jgi:AbrB family looped-hinge helix DNA binding protein
MSKVTGKYQLTLPKRLAEQYGIKVGDDVELVAAGASIAIVPANAVSSAMAVEERLQHFDAASARQRARERARRLKPAKKRGWTRAGLYERGRAR